MRVLVLGAVLAVTLLACTDAPPADENPSPGAGESAEVDGEITAEATDEATDEDAAVDAGEPVTITGPDLDLAGTLRLPAGEGPFPGAVLIHGSGPIDASGSVPGQLGVTFPRPVPVYAELAAGLARAGVAVLTWDKRTCGPFNGCAENAYPLPADDLVVGDFMADASAALDLLAARADIGPLVVMGHSQGATLAPLVAADRDDVAAVVMIAAPYDTIDQTLAEQADTLVELAGQLGQDTSAAEAQVAPLRSDAEAVAEIASGDVGGPPVGGAPRAFWASWIDAGRRAQEVVAALDRPVLIVAGDADFNVPPDQLEAWRSVAGESADVRLLPDLSHVLTDLDADDLASIGVADLALEVSPRAVQAIAEWLAAQL